MTENSFPPVNPTGEFPMHTVAEPTGSGWAWTGLALTLVPFTTLAGLVVSIIGIFKTKQKGGTPFYVAITATIVASVFLFLQGLLVTVFVSELTSHEHWNHSVSRKQLTEDNSTYDFPRDNKDDHFGDSDKPRSFKENAFLELVKGGSVTDTVVSGDMIETPCYTFELPDRALIGLPEDGYTCEVVVYASNNAGKRDFTQSVVIRPLSGPFAATDAFAQVKDQLVKENAKETSIVKVRENGMSGFKTETPSSETFAVPTTTYYLETPNRNRTLDGKPSQAILLEAPRGLKEHSYSDDLLIEEILDSLVLK